jgi:hypothetical protein
MSSYTSENRSHKAWNAMNYIDIDVASAAADDYNDDDEWWWLINEYWWW